MAQKIITELQLRDNVTDEVNFATDDGIQSYRVTAAQVKAYLESLISPGLIAPFGGATVPDKWLLCNGAAVDRTTYANLFAAIGVTWGVGDGSTTFNLPDLRGRTLIGAGTGSGLSARTLGTQNIGAETHVLSTSEIPAHSHGVTDPGHTHSITAGTDSAYGAGPQAALKAAGGTTTTSNTTGVSIQNAGGGGAHANMQPSAVVQWIIRTG